MGYLVVGKGKSESCGANSSNLEPLDKDLWDRAREHGLLSEGHAAGAFDRDGHPMDDGWICVVASVDEVDLDRDAAVIAYCTESEDTEPTDSMPVVREVAASCAATLLEQGWQGDGSTYDLGAFPGDIEALADKLGTAPTTGQRLALEAAIREALNGAAKGAEGGVEDVETVLREQGRDVVIATLTPGHLGWDEGAINAAAHRADGVEDDFQDLYYKAYATAARKRAEEIRDEAAKEAA